MDAVYILGSGSQADNKEILYSVRSLARNMLDLRNVYIVGENSNNLPSAKHIFVEDSFTEKWKNAYKKIRYICDIDDVSEEFLLMNDDFFMLETFTGEDFPFYALKGAQGGMNGRYYFGVHCPIRIKKEWYLKLPLTLEMKGDYSPRSFYCNFFFAPPTFTTDPIVRHGADMLDFDTQILGREYFSISNGTMLNNDFVSWLDSLFPTPSRFEK